MNDMTEKTFLQEGMVRITDRRTLIGTDTYPVAEITSVSVARRPRTKRYLWFLIPGILLILWGEYDQTGYYGVFYNWGMILSVVGLALTLLAKPSYIIQIRNGSGIRSILGSTDLRFVQRIVGAMNQAIAGKRKTV
jgi:hypothetical protein